jgi:hypothetical protein
MDALLDESKKLSKTGSLSESIEDVQKLQDLLIRARSSISDGKLLVSVATTDIHSSFYCFHYSRKASKSCQARV